MVKRLSNRPDEQVLAHLVRGKRLALRVVLVVAGSILALWFLPELARFAPPIWSEMTANSALGMLLGAAGFALTAQGRSIGALRLGRFAAAGALLIGLVTLLEFAYGVTTVIDHWLPVDWHSRYPGRPSPQTATGLSLVGLSLLIAREHKNWRSWAADFLALLLISLTLILLGGYCYGAFQIVGIDRSTLTSPQTLLCLCCLSFVITGRRAVNGRVFAPLVSMGIGSYIVRMVLFGAVVVPFLFFSGVAYLIQSGTLSAPYAYATIAALESLSILCVVIWMSRRINALEGDLRDLSLTDELTRINNRRGFYLLASQVFRDASRGGHGIALYYFDLDGLKRANDSFGHDTGSRLLTALAAILLETFRDNDVVGRLGGDEFAVVTTHGGELAQSVLARIEKRIAAFNASAGLPCLLEYSVGYVEHAAGSPADFDELMATADAMMYREKQLKASRHLAA